MALTRPLRRSARTQSRSQATASSLRGNETSQRHGGRQQPTGDVQQLVDVQGQLVAGAFGFGGASQRQGLQEHAGRAAKRFTDPVSRSIRSLSMQTCRPRLSQQEQRAFRQQASHSAARASARSRLAIRACLRSWNSKLARARSMRRLEVSRTSLRCCASSEPISPDCTAAKTNSAKKQATKNKSNPRQVMLPLRLRKVRCPARSRRHASSK